MGIPSLTDDQENITYQPNSCYIVSSRNSKQNQNFHSSNPEKEMQQMEQQQMDEQKNQSMEQKGNDGDAMADNIVEQKEEKDTGQQNDNVDDEELPTIRWTDSAHGHHEHEHEQDEKDEIEYDHKEYNDDKKQNIIQTTQQPIGSKQTVSLLDKLEQETEEVLSSQQ